MGFRGKLTNQPQYDIIKKKKESDKMTEEEMIKEAEAVVENWTDTVLWYMQEYAADLEYEKIADIFIKSFTIQAKEMVQELTKRYEEE